VNIVNPIYNPGPDNIFSIRKKEYENIIGNITEILKPTEEIGFQISELYLKSPRFSTGELQKTIKQLIVIKLQKGASVVDLSLQLPMLVDDNHFIINGRKKVALFQLFDMPIVCRNSVIFRSNVTTIQVEWSKKSGCVVMKFQKKEVPIAIFMAGFFGIEATIEKYDLNNLPPLKEKPKLVDLILNDCNLFCNSHLGTPHAEIVKMIGSYFTKHNATGKGEEVLYSIRIVPEVDIFTKKFMITDNIFDEVIEVLKLGGYDDTDFKNKRIRYLEYILYGEVMRNVFSMCISSRETAEPKFNVKSSRILEECNVSSAVQFDFCINPIDEITKLSKSTLIGPGGFKERQHVQSYLKDISPTMFGRICPVDTPDRDNCGILQNLLPNTILDENLKFTDQFLDKQIISAPVSMVPFLEHDDQTRLQMAASQMRQAIMLKNFDKPLVGSGCENLYTKYSQFIHIAKNNGKVIYFDKKWIIVKYVDNMIDTFMVDHRHIYTENLDWMRVYIEEGEEFEKGQILAESNYCKNGHIVFGKNLLTAVMGYYGDNYEDGIVISDRLVEEDVFTSMHYIDLSFTISPNKVLLSLSDKEYKPFPEIGESISVGDIYAKIKDIPYSPQDFASIFEEEYCLYAKKDIMITNIEIYANEWNEHIPQWKNWVETKIEEQESSQQKIQELIFENLGKDEALNFIKNHNIDRFGHTTKYRIKGELINGIQVKMFGAYQRKIQIGDKIGNRHGNKGVISRIIPAKDMPKMEDGRNVDICINPLGIISRMNIGQLFELHFGMAINDLKIKLLSMLKDEINQEEIKSYILGFLNIADKTEDSWYYKQFKQQLPEIITEEFVNDLTFIQPPFESMKVDDETELLKYTDTKFEYNILDPRTNINILNPIAVGIMYFFRMVHIAENRVAARGVGTYMRKTMQPLSGRKNAGGQRLGEMETACLIAHDAMENLHEFFTTKSDCVDLKNQYIRNQIEFECNPKENLEVDMIPESVKLLDSYLVVCGLIK
jgi:hypothetical protein